MVEILQSLPSGKAADAQGLTCELLRLATVRAPSSAVEDGHEVEYVCEPLVACLTYIVQNLTTDVVAAACSVTGQQAYACAKIWPSYSPTGQKHVQGHQCC